MQWHDFESIFKTQINKVKGTRWGVLSTFGEKYPESRNVIIRDFNEVSLIFYTHSLSKKIQEITQNPNGSLCWYNPNHNIQLQFYGELEILDDPETKFYQNKIQHFNDYCGLAPGSEYIDDSCEDIHFSVIRLNIKKIVGLKIQREGHLKYRFDIDQDFKQTRLIP
jgi:hypothetical protein